MGAHMYALGVHTWVTLFVNVGIVGFFIAAVMSGLLGPTREVKSSRPRRLHSHAPWHLSLIEAADPCMHPLSPLWVATLQMRWINVEFQMEKPPCILQSLLC